MFLGHRLFGHDRGSWLWRLSSIYRVLTIGGMVAFYSYMGRLFDPLRAAVDIYSQLNRLGTNIRRILEVTEMTPSVADRPDAVNFPSLFHGYVELDHVSFAYRDGELILRASI